MSRQDNISDNVQSLIDHLHEDGVVAGQEAGKQIIEDAEKRAEWIITQAEQQAQDLLDSAQTDAKFINESAHAALKLAARDVVFSLKEQLQNHLASQLQKLIGEQMANRAFMVDLLHEAIEQQWFNEQKVTLLIPKNILDVSSIDELGKQAEDDPLLPAIRRLTKSALKKGISLSNFEGSNGIHIKLANDKVEIVTNDQTLSEWLLQFVHPRFRALIDGVIR